MASFLDYVLRKGEKFQNNWRCVFLISSLMKFSIRQLSVIRQMSILEIWVLGPIVEHVCLTSCCLSILWFLISNFFFSWTNCFQQKSYFIEKVFHCGNLSFLIHKTPGIRALESLLCCLIRISIWCLQQYFSISVIKLLGRKLCVVLSLLWLLFSAFSCWIWERICVHSSLCDIP